MVGKFATRCFIPSVAVPTRAITQVSRRRISPPPRCQKACERDPGPLSNDQNLWMTLGGAA